VYKGNTQTVIEVRYPTVGADIVEQVLKTHRLSWEEPGTDLGNNTVMVVYAEKGTGLGVRIYTQDANSFLQKPTGIDCKPLCISFGGGGHSQRGGFDVESHDYTVITAATDRVLEELSIQK